MTTLDKKCTNPPPNDESLTDSDFIRLDFDVTKSISESAPVKRRILTILIALDIFVFAVITLGGTKRNETISAAAWELERDGKWTGKLFRPLIDFLFSAIQHNHCHEAWLIENTETWSI